MSAVLRPPGKLIFDEKAKGILPLFPLGGGRAANKEAPKGVHARPHRSRRLGDPGARHALSTFYTVSEQEQVVIRSSASPSGRPSPHPGLHVKVPFTQDVNVFDKRWLEWNGNPNQVPTRDKKYIWVETYARCGSPIPSSSSSGRGRARRQSRLDDIIDGETRNVIASHNLVEIVRVAAAPSRRPRRRRTSWKPRRCGRSSWGATEITRLIRERASQVMPDYGIELVDVRSSASTTSEVQAKVFDRMISERKRIATAIARRARARARRSAARRSAS